jgi:hypothetical protein
MKYTILESAQYEVEADSPQEALRRFLGESGINCPFPTQIDDRLVLDETGETCEVDDD